MSRVLFALAIGSRWTTLALAGVAAALFAPSARAQIIAAPAEATSVDRFGPAVATRYRVGAKIVGKAGAVQNIRVMVAVPLECDEQQVQVVDESFSPLVENVDYRVLDDNGARQMLINIPQLPPRQTAEATVTFEVITRSVLPPKETAGLVAPADPDRTLKRYLGPSPYIDVGHRKIRAAVKEALATLDEKGAEKKEEVELKNPPPSKGGARGGISSESNDDAVEDSAADLKPLTQPLAATAALRPSGERGKGDWQRVEALYDYAIEHVKYEEGVDKSSVQALAQGKGDCQAIAALFVAMCRTEKIPARMVWVDGHQYAEFYLEHAQGKGRWYPVESAGTRAFGEMPIARVILQKGDNFRVPERRRERLRYASDYAMFLSTPKNQPKVTYIREQL